MKYWMETKMPRRLLSLALSIVMVLSLLPAGAMAEEAESTPLSCTCEVACAETVNADCPVCGTEAGQCAAAQEPEALLQEQEPQPESVPNPEPCAHGNAPEGCEACASEARVDAVQALIDALPDTDSITLDNAETVVTQMDEIDAAAMLLSEAELAKLDFAKFDAAQARLIELSDQQLTEQPVAYANNIPYLACDSNGQNWETKPCATATVVTGSDTEWSTGWYVVQKHSYIEGRLSISGNVSLILADGYSLDVDGGIDIPFRSTLTIYA